MEDTKVLGQVGVHGHFDITSQLWKTKYLQKGCFSDTTGVLRAVGPLARIMALDLEHSVFSSQCVFCDEISPEEDTKQCRNCGRNLINHFFWLRDREGDSIFLGSPVCFKNEHNRSMAGVITGVDMNISRERIEVHAYETKKGTSTPLLPTEINLEKVVLKRSHLESRATDLRKLAKDSPEIKILSHRGLCGQCRGLYFLGRGELLHVEGGKLDTAQYSYNMLSEKLRIAFDQRKIFKSKGQKEKVLFVQENINQMLEKQKELHPTLSSVSVGCTRCGWNIFQGPVHFNSST